jgi:hypothetical protein
MRPERASYAHFGSITAPSWLRPGPNAVTAIGKHARIECRWERGYPLLEAWPSGICQSRQPALRAEERCSDREVEPTAGDEGSPADAIADAISFVAQLCCANSYELPSGPMRR